MFYRLVNDEKALGLVLGKNKSESPQARPQLKKRVHNTTRRCWCFGLIAC
ncbi:hypothetical protein SAMN05421647_11483 [Marinobacterium stanieri]|uniref:Uncharacterized protein n=1 Tax=Marinobacterium stanieri TaxID=49186 RepID=A0A1N6XKU1_9GAMM|nr:hypothetical protein SAMN05421647_11483 [Marinobacterium stanieri]